MCAKYAPGPHVCGGRGSRRRVGERDARRVQSACAAERSREGMGIVRGVGGWRERMRWGCQSNAQATGWLVQYMYVLTGKTFGGKRANATTKSKATLAFITPSACERRHRASFFAPPISARSRHDLPHWLLFETQKKKKALAHHVRLLTRGKKKLPKRHGARAGCPKPNETH